MNFGLSLQLWQHEHDKLACSVAGKCSIHLKYAIFASSVWKEQYSSSHHQFFTTGSKNGLWCSLLYQLEFCYATEDHEDRQRVWKKFTGVNAILNDVLITPSFDNAVLFSEPFHSKGIFSEGIFCGFSVT